MEKVIAEFGSGVGTVALTDHQKRLAQNYFIALDAVLATAEEKRMKKSEQYREGLPYTWQNVNMAGLARAVVAKAQIGLDPAQKNHIHMIPYKNNTPPTNTTSGLSTDTGALN
jgi:recombination protein RecT